MAVTIKDLQNFEAECATDLQKIKSSLNECNVFNVLKVHKREIRHSNFLGWLFDPNESHQLGALFLKELLKLTEENGGLPTEKLQTLLSEDLTETDVRRETEKDIDILIVNIPKDFVICIENKIDHHFSQDQLKKYYNHVEDKYRHMHHRLYIALTPAPTYAYKEREKGEMYRNITYSDIIHILNNNMQAIKEVSQAGIRENLMQYRRMVQKEIIMNNEEVQLARQIYSKYKREIDFIIANKEDFSNHKSEIQHYFKESNTDYIESHPPNGNVLYLLPDKESLRRIFHYPQAKSRGGNYIFSLVLYLEKDRVWMKMGFGNIAQGEHYDELVQIRQELYEAMRNFEIFKNVDKNEIPLKLYGKETATSSYPTIAEVDLFTSEELVASGLDFFGLFKQRFDTIDKLLLQPWIEECIRELKVI